MGKTEGLDTKENEISKCVHVLFTGSKIPELSANCGEGHLMALSDLGDETVGSHVTVYQCSMVLNFSGWSKVQSK